MVSVVTLPLRTHSRLVVEGRVVLSFQSVSACAISRLLQLWLSLDRILVRVLLACRCCLVHAVLCSFDWALVSRLGPHALFHRRRLVVFKRVRLLASHILGNVIVHYGGDITAPHTRFEGHTCVSGEDTVLVLSTHSLLSLGQHAVT